MLRGRFCLSRPLFAQHAAAPVFVSRHQFFSTDPVQIRKLLVANRGEIACRVMRTAKNMGIETVAVYSDADKNAMHVHMADEAYNVGPAPSVESYLVGERIIDTALRCGAQAIHPGYGFLSENAEFSEQCAKAGVIFVGPTASSIRAMGCKRQSKELMENAAVPMVPGYHGKDQDPQVLHAAADKIGYPVIIKPTAGGGGKGMRIVYESSKFKEQLASSQREAATSFKETSVIIEKYIGKPRHIEVQVFGDTHGNVVHLFERDCSVQRRHQKIVEEAPAPGVDAAFRQAIGQAAVNAAKAVDYVGAGTVEFIVDENMNFFFMEMNTRLQVEHPVTEMVTRQDLVRWQLGVAAGGKLPLEQSELGLTGAAVEARIYAENPDNNFLPGAGKLAHLRPPAENEYIRVDTGVRSQDTVSPFYDPMIAKLVVWGEDRATALRRMRRALRDYQIVGVPSNVHFVGKVVDHPAFVKGQVDTTFIEKYHDELFARPLAAHVNDAAVFGAFHLLLQEATAFPASSEDPNSPFALADGYRVNGSLKRALKFGLEVDGNTEDLAVGVTYSGNGTFNVKVGTNDEQTLRGDRLADGSLRVVLHGQVFHPTVFQHKNSLHVMCGERSAVFVLPEQDFSMDAGASKSTINAPMAGKVVKVMVNEGDSVTKGAPLVVMEAMKMEHTLTAPYDGTVDGVFAADGELVEDGKVLASVKPKDA